MTGEQFRLRRALARIPGHMVSHRAGIGRGRLAKDALKPEAKPDDRLEPVLKGRAIELWSDTAGEILFLVADEADAAVLKEPRRTIYTASEARLVTRITDPKIAKEIHSYKRRFNGKMQGYKPEGKGR